MPALIARLLAVTLVITAAALIVVAFFAPPAHAITPAVHSDRAEPAVMAPSSSSSEAAP